MGKVPVLLLWHNPDRTVKSKYNIFQANSLEELFVFCISGTFAGDYFCDYSKPDTSLGSLTQFRFEMYQFPKYPTGIITTFEHASKVLK